MIDFDMTKHGGIRLLTLRRIAKFGIARAEAEIRARAHYAYLGDRLGLCRVLGRFKMYVDPQDVGHSSHLILEGAWELWVTRFLISRMRSGMVAIDVGANLGYFTVLMAEMVGNEGSVHAFEPNVAVADRLEKTITVNGFGDVVTLHRDAVGASNEHAVKLIVPDYLPSGAWLVPVEAEEIGNSVDVRRLDDYPELRRASVVKIDAEGYEYEVWKGMAGCVAQGHPMLILLEYANGRYSEREAFVAEIFAAGFKISAMDETGKLCVVSSEDILAWPPGKDKMLILERS